MAIETLTADRWLYGVLSGDATLATQVGTRIYQGQAEQSAAPPYVVFSFQGGHDVWGNAMTRVMASLVYLVRVIGTGTFKSLETAADRIDTLLQGGSGAAVDGSVFACVREQPFQQMENQPGGVIYRHVGGLYRLYAQSP